MGEPKVRTLSEALRINNDLPASVYVFGHEVLLKSNPERTLGGGQVEVDAVRLAVALVKKRGWVVEVQLTLDPVVKLHHKSKHRPTFGEAIIECEQRLQKEHARILSIWNPK